MFTKKRLWVILTSVFAALTAVFIVGTSLAISLGQLAINKILGTSNSITVNDPNAEPTTFFASDYGEDFDGEDLFEEDKKMIEEAEGEGAVLLWNKNNALPMQGNEKISFLGRWSTDITETGTGSGYSVTRDIKSARERSVNLKDAFKSRGFEVNDALWNFYSSGAGKTSKVDPKDQCVGNVVWSMNETPWSKYTETVKSSFSNYSDAAIVVLSRTGGENSDLHESSEVSYENGGYLGLTNEEKVLLQKAVEYKNNGTFKRVILMLNTVNPLNMRDIAPYVDGIDSCVWIGQPGSSGTNAVADIFKGAITPSGRIPDTYVYDNLSAPATENDGLNSACDVNKYKGDLRGLGYQAQNGDSQTKYIVYQEGIYIGYRYYETRYADSVLGQGNATSTKGAKNSKSGWNYDEEVAFPFGYGVSYTTFDYSGFNVEKKGDDYEVSVTVKNSGEYEGKEVVQVYMQKPYTAYDEQKGLEKPAIELAGYAKTQLLKKGDSETVKITVKGEDFKTFDNTYNNYEGRYIIEPGDYYLTVGTDAHVALNNVLKKQGKEAGEQKVMSGDAKKVNFAGENVYKVTLEKDNEKYLNSTHTGAKITNKLSYGDINLYENRGENSTTYLSRSDWEKTYPERVILTMNSKMKADLGFEFDFEKTEYFMPTYGNFKSGSTNGEPDVRKGDLVAYQFIKAPLFPEDAPNQDEVYKDTGRTYAEWAELWDQLLDQMTWEEQSALCTNGYHQMEAAKSISLPGSKQENGPVGITYCAQFATPDVVAKIRDFVFVGYPCAPILAASFNDELVERVGRHMSEDMLYTGYNGIYGPGVNLHRSPYGGRAFEYPSEDPYLAGKIMAAECRGIEYKGALAYPKHFALNEMETSRMHCGVWSNEQASREIYLRAFEIVFTEGEASATMNSFTRVGTRWCGASKELMTDILRGEWGFDGIIITDWDEGKVMNKLDAILAGTNTFDGNGSLGSYTKWRDDATVAAALRKSSRYLIWNIVNTNVMNGTTEYTKVVIITPWWKMALYAIDTTFGAITLICAGMTVASFIISAKNKKHAAGAE